MKRPVKNAAQSGGVRSGRTLCALLGVILALAGPLGVANGSSPAVADAEPSRAARRRFQSAEVHFHAGRFAEALADYQAGYDAAPLPGFLVNIAQCQRRLGDLKKARATYQRFLLVAPDSPLGPDVKALISEIDQALLDPTSATDADTSPEDVGHDVKNPHTIPAPLPAAPEVVAAAPALVALPVPAVDHLGAPTAPRRTSRARWWLWGTLAAVAVGGAVGIVALLPPDAVTLHEGSLGTLRR